jgi:fructosamine-3-kinase
MMQHLDIERFDQLISYLRERGQVGPVETPACTPLPGGISNRTVLVERADGMSFVLKQALPKLRVATDWPSDPRRVHQEALGLTWLRRLAPEGTITTLIFEDATHHLLAMEAVPRPHENWKARLLAGGLEEKHVVQFGECLGAIHRRSSEHAELAAIFAERTFFETLRLEPYYRYTATQQPLAAGFFNGLITETMETRTALVHGDFSPKNVLIHQDKLVFLDHEAIHFGDPAFDIGFSLTHLLSKANHLPSQRKAFLNAARLYWNSYLQAAGGLARQGGFEARSVRHTLGCLLARVDGRSPLEYLNRSERDRQRTAVLSLIGKTIITIPELVDSFADNLILLTNVQHRETWRPGNPG